MRHLAHTIEAVMEKISLFIMHDHMRGEVNEIMWDPRCLPAALSRAIPITIPNSKTQNSGWSIVVDPILEVLCGRS